MRIRIFSYFNVYLPDDTCATNKLLWPPILLKFKNDTYNKKSSAKAVAAPIEIDTVKDTGRRKREIREP